MEDSYEGNPPVNGPALRAKLIAEGIIKPNRIGIVAPNSPSLAVCGNCGCWDEGETYNPATMKWETRRKPAKLVNGELLVIFDRRCPLIGRAKS